MSVASVSESSESVLLESFPHIAPDGAVMVGAEPAMHVPPPDGAAQAVVVTLTVRELYALVDALIVASESPQLREPEWDGQNPEASPLALPSC